MQGPAVKHCIFVPLRQEEIAKPCVLGSPTIVRLGRGDRQLPIRATAEYIRGI